MRYFKIFTGVVALCALCITSSYAQKNDPVINKVIEIAKTDNQTMMHTRMPVTGLNICSRNGVLRFGNRKLVKCL